MKRWGKWIVDRLGLLPIWRNTLDRRVLSTPWYYGDGFTLMLLLGVLIVTGMFMTLTYSPTPDEAYASVAFITENQVLGWFIRAFHYWSAGLMVVMLFFHLFRVVLVGAYKEPREGMFIIGVFIFFAVLLMSVTGYMLRWDERGIFALKVMLHHLNNLPWIGGYLVVLVQGGAELGAQTLTRIYSIHVLFVPLTLLALTGFHLYLVILKGVSSKAEHDEPIHSEEQLKAIHQEKAESEEHGEHFFPETVLDSGLLATVVLLAALLLAIFVGPANLYPEANLTDPAIPREEWWLWWYSALIALLPPAVAPAIVVALPVLVFLILFSLPFIDRGPHRGIRDRPWIAVGVAVLVGVLLFLTNLRYSSPWTGWPRSTPPEVPAGTELTASAEEGRQLFATYGCNSCHAVSGDGPRVAVDLARLEPPMDHQALSRFILSRTEDIAMPMYEGRITEDDLQKIVEFVLVAQTFPRE